MCEYGSEPYGFLPGISFLWSAAQHVPKIHVIAIRQLAEKQSDYP